MRLLPLKIYMEHLSSASSPFFLPPYAHIATDVGQTPQVWMWQGMWDRYRLQRPGQAAAQTQALVCLFFHLVAFVQPVAFWSQTLRVDRYRVTL